MDIRNSSRWVQYPVWQQWLGMLGITLAIAIGASLLAGLLPAWRAALVTPALQLKVQ